MTKFNRIILRKGFIYLVLTFIFLSTAFIGEKRSLYLQNNSIEVNEFQEVLFDKKNEITNICNEVTNNITKHSYQDFFKQNTEKHKTLLKEKGLAVLVFKYNELIYWSDNSIASNEEKILTEINEKIIYLQNSWFKVIKVEETEYTIIGLILIKNQYPFENSFLSNSFNADFNIKYDFDLTRTPAPDGYQITDIEGEFLFSLIPKKTIITNQFIYYTIGILYLIGILFFLLFFNTIFYKLLSIKKSNWWLLAFLIDLVLFRYLMIYLNIPEIFYSYDIFAPQYFSGSAINPSLGDMLLNSIFLFIFSYTFFKEFSISVKNKFKNSLLLISGIAITLLLFFTTIYSFYSLIVNSSITLEIYKIFDLSFYTIICFIVIAFLFISFLLITNKIVSELLKIFNPLKLSIYFLSSIVIISLCFHFFFKDIFPLYSILFLICVILIFLIIHSKKIDFKFSLITVIIFSVSVFSAVYITKTATKKERKEREVLAVKLATERDLITELLLEDFNKKLNEDKIIKRFIRTSYENEENLITHLQRNYFNGFLRKYDFQISICSPIDSVLIESENNWYHCYNYFEELMKENSAYQIPSTNFYYNDNLNGKISYVGYSNYFYPLDTTEISLFFELNSKLVTKTLGYPELLLDNKRSKVSLLNDYSYAKYHNSQLINQFGEYPYSLNSKTYPATGLDFNFVNFDGFSHLIYKSDKENTIIISKPTIKGIDILISFSYIFVFFYILFSIIYFTANISHIFTDFSMNFKTRIQLSMIIVLLLSLIFVGGGTVYYNIEQFQQKNNQNISEKIQSVLIELEHKLGTEKELAPSLYDFVSYYLVKFSNVFYSDINIYDLEGNLFASSRPEIFEKGLIGNKMNSEAFKELIINEKAEFVHKEKIGDLEYISGYIPFRNNENEILAYLNLPYFTKQSELKKEISSLVIAVVNIYVLLILLTIIIALVISNRITQPLQLIQRKFREIHLQKKNELIHYNRNDEIGGLIKEYNRMVEEITHSAELLAKSERESAWREMAKQIAHEIKNPLTPMKLNVQLLQRSWDNKDKDFEKRLKSVSEILIDQIEALSTIATEFSNFADIPKTNFERVNIIEKVKNSVRLFNETENTQINIELNDNIDLFVLADKEKLLQVFNNLIQNAIQAVPDNRQKIINIEIYTKVNDIIVKISDNGKGISDELKDKLFIPNFTTKTSGMGLGLAIVKKIVENAKGKIWFETEIDTGSSFYISLPKID